MGKLIPTVRWSPDGTQLVSASLDRTGRLWVSPALEVGPVLNGHTEGVLSAAFVPDRSAVVTERMAPCAGGTHRRVARAR